MAIEGGFVETTIGRGESDVIWINSAGITRTAPKTFKLPIISGISPDQQFHPGMLLIHFFEGVGEPQELMPTAVGLSAQAFSKLANLFKA